MPRPGSLFVAKVRRSVRAADLEDIFDRYGPLTRCEVKYGAEMAYGFVDYEDKRDAEDALRNENGRELHGQCIVIEWAKSTPRRSTYGGGGRGGYRDRDDDRDRSRRRRSPPRRRRSRSRDRRRRSYSRSLSRSPRRHRDERDYYDDRKSQDRDDEDRRSSRRDGDEKRREDAADASPRENGRSKSKERD